MRFVCTTNNSDRRLSMKHGSPISKSILKVKFSVSRWLDYLYYPYTKSSQVPFAFVYFFVKTKFVDCIVSRRTLLDFVRKFSFTSWTKTLLSLLNTSTESEQNRHYLTIMYARNIVLTFGNNCFEDKKTASWGMSSRTRLTC